MSLLMLRYSTRNTNMAINNNLFSVNNFFCTFKKQQSIKNFPYVFGGIKKYDVPSESDNQIFVETIFGKQINTGFIYAYKQLLRALQSKDKQFLRGLLEKNLLKNINFPNVRLVNDKKKVKSYIGNLYLSLGLAFDRSLHPEKGFLDRKFNQGTLLSLRTNNLKDQQGRIIISVIIQAYFTGSIKLVHNQNQPEQSLPEQIQKQDKRDDNSSQQTHMIQFQIESRFHFWQIIKILYKRLFRNIFSPDKFYQEVTIQLLGLQSQDFMWRISDIDKVLKGNLPPIQDISGAS